MKIIFAATQHTCCCGILSLGRGFALSDLTCCCSICYRVANPRRGDVGHRLLNSFPPLLSIKLSPNGRSEEGIIFINTRYTVKITWLKTSTRVRCLNMIPVSVCLSVPCAFGTVAWFWRLALNTALEYINTISGGHFIVIRIVWTLLL